MQMKIERQAHSAIDIVQTEGKGLFWVRRRRFPGQAHRVIDALSIFNIDGLAIFGQAYLVMYGTLYQVLGIEGWLHRHPLLFHVAPMVPLLLLSVCKHKQQHSAATSVVKNKMRSVATGKYCTTILPERSGCGNTLCRQYVRNLPLEYAK
jgi:hypothetical protein